jgi:hypothetical protein
LESRRPECDEQKIIDINKEVNENEWKEDTKEGRR